MLVFTFVITLGYSRRMFVRAHPNERLGFLLAGHEDAFAFFSGVTAPILYNNPITMVTRLTAVWDKRSVPSRRIPRTLPGRECPGSTPGKLRSGVFGELGPSCPVSLIFRCTPLVYGSTILNSVALFINDTRLSKFQDELLLSLRKSMISWGPTIISFVLGLVRPT